MIGWGSCTNSFTYSMGERLPTLLFETACLDEDPGDLVGVAVGGGSPVLQVPLPLLRHAPGDPDRAASVGENVETYICMVLLIIQQCHLLATPAEKSWMEDISPRPVRRRSLSFPANE